MDSDKRKKTPAEDEELLLPDLGEDVSNKIEETAADDADTAPSAIASDYVNDADELKDAPQRTKGAAFYVGIVAVLGLCVLFAWLLAKENPLVSNRDSGAAYSSVKVTDGTMANPSLDNERFSFTSAQSSAAGAQPVAVKKEVKVVKPAAASTSGIASAAAVQTTAKSGSAYDDRIEREAREVIHGDFGDNPGRRKALGADYAAVQARVNEILHQ